MQGLGQFLLIVTFFVTLLTAFTAIIGATTKREVLMRGARFGVYAVAGLNIAMALILTHGFLTHDFSNKYIATYSDRSMPTMYLLAAFWGGEKGALLFWTTSLSIFSAIAVHVNREKAAAYMAWVAALLMLSIFFFDILMVFESSPFETFLTTDGPRDGKGLNPALQNPTMAFHPPSLLTGYITFTIPFAFAMAALITGKLDSQWITDTRRWTLVSFLFLTIGLILGMVWAYEEIGWGFWWMWDPVENAGLIPWFTATAFLHSVMIQERRGMFRRWNMILVCMTFFLTIFGTFLTRSQLIDSIHAFADSTLAEYFIWYLLVLAVVSSILIGFRWKALRGEDSIESFWSRESFFVLNNLFLVSCAFIVLFGTLIPKITEAEAVRDGYNTMAGWLGRAPVDQSISLDEAWFNEVMAPIGLLLLLLAGSGPLISWRRATVSNFRKNFLIPLCGSLVLTVIGTVVGVLLKLEEMRNELDITFSEAYAQWAEPIGLIECYVVFAYFTCGFVTWTIVREFHLGTMIRKAKSGDSYFGSLTALTMKAPRRYGGYIVHLGIVLMFIAFTGKFFKTQEERTLNPGETVSAENYRITYATKKQFYDEENGFAADRAIVTVVSPEETVAEREVASLAGWLQTQDVGIFHVETRLGSPKITVRFQDQAQQDRLTDDLFLSMTFKQTFKLETENRASKRLIYRIADEKLVNVVPMVAMNVIRLARDAFQGSATIGAKFQARPGSPLISLNFTTEASMDAFLSRVEAARPPPHILATVTNHDLEALQFIDDRTGVQRAPEVRYYPTHPDSPTTEASITSSFKEDLYLAIQPQRGVMDAFSSFEIKLLTVIFPFVNFLWTGGILIVFGIMLCMIPRWLSRTLISLTRRRRKSGTAAATAALVLLTCLLGIATPDKAHAALQMPSPSGFAGPAGSALEDTLAVLRCMCGYGDDATRLPETIADAKCDCPRAQAERRQVAGLLDKYEDEDKKTGKAKFLVLKSLTKLEAEWLERIDYKRRDFEFLMSSTKTTCSGERGLALGQSQLGCSVRNLWAPRFKIMLASGMPLRTIFEFYVDENNVTMGPKTPWTYDDLYAAADKPLTWAVPLTFSVAFVVLFVWFMLRRTKRLDQLRAEQNLGDSAPHLGHEERLRLADEMDAYDI
jgi:cytochrome c-type biogenesis protein CcmF